MLPDLGFAHAVLHQRGDAFFQRLRRLIRERDGVVLGGDNNVLVFMHGRWQYRKDIQLVHQPPLSGAHPPCWVVLLADDRPRSESFQLAKNGPDPLFGNSFPNALDRRIQARGRLVTLRCWEFLWEGMDTAFETDRRRPRKGVRQICG